MLDLHDLYGIELFGAIPLRECVIAKPYLLERAGITSDGSVLLMLLPYYDSDAEGGNVSMYAAVEDYHAYARELFADMCARLCGLCPDAKFAGFADHAPIYEVAAAAKAGLGVYGENGLLLTEKYSSFIFIAGVYTSLPATEWTNLVKNVTLPATFESKRCIKCGACRDACPAHAIGSDGHIDRERCLSAVTQKKSLTERDAGAVADADYVWGCDVCQLVCPYTRAAKKAGTLETKLEYFRRRLIKNLDEATLCSLTESGEFPRRAFSWRGVEPVRRNLRLHGGSAGNGAKSDGENNNNGNERQ